MAEIWHLQRIFEIEGFRVVKFVPFDKSLFFVLGIEAFSLDIIFWYRFVFHLYSLLRCFLFNSGISLVAVAYINFILRKLWNIF